MASILTKKSVQAQRRCMQTTQTPVIFHRLLANCTKWQHILQHLQLFTTMASGEVAIDPTGEVEKADNGGKWANGTLLYWKFENGNFWGSIRGQKDGVYSTSWSDGDVHQLNEKAIRSMVYHAQETLVNIPDHFLTGTRVHKYFETEGGWWSGMIVDRDTDHNYIIEWSDGRQEQWNALYTVAMVQDANDFPMDASAESKEEVESSVDDSSTSGSGSEASSSEDEPVEESQDEDHTSVASDTSDALFPGSFPQTEEGLKDFLRYVDGNTSENGHQEDEFQEDAIYQANLKVDASQKNEIPIPIMVPHSLVEWAIRIDERDIKFALRRKSLKEDTSEEEEIIVENHYLYAREDETEHEEPPIENGAAGGRSEVTVDATEKGEFYVEDASSTIILEFDNTYSWITEKAVSYHVRVIPPLPPSIAERAEKSFPFVAKALEQAKYEVTFSQQAVAAAKQNIAHTHYRFQQIDQDIDTKQLHLQQIKQTALGLGERRAVEGQKLQAQRKRLADKTLYIQKLEEAMRELEKERQLCWKEKQLIENSLYDQERQLILFDDKCKQVDREAEDLNLDLCDLQIEVLMKENDVTDVEESLEKAKADEEEANRHFEFMQRVEGGLKKRMK